MAIDLAYRRRAVRQVINDVGVYVLCDLDQVPIYVGQSTDGIRNRVRRHLTSARSDIIANRQVDVWEIAWVWAFPVADRGDIDALEARLFAYHNARSALMQSAKFRAVPASDEALLEPFQIVQVMAPQEIEEKRQGALRLPRQAEHYSQIVGHFIAVKNSAEVARAMHAHFERLARYHRGLLGAADPQAEDG